MPIYALPDEFLFPDPREADDSGLIAVGGDLHPERVLRGYAAGIFPWYSEGQPILWHSPDPRFILEIGDLKVSRSLKQRLRKRPFVLRMDTAFEQVIDACARSPRPGQDGTWITSAMRDAYVRLHEEGFAHSVEAWEGDILVGGLYGVSLGSVFFGESMFAQRPDASKVAFACFVRELRRWGFNLLDSQVYTDHLARFGAKEVPRSAYLRQLRKSLRAPTRRGVWRFGADPYEGYVAENGVAK
ncbi:MAG: leucyl/phenylalanyl-tRNA--protein transferase [Deltaproteobacteria bacterium]|nr:leucyl/phenylalanyl-tRNA--protein transferase [Deltaproteobacteria bacterium]